MQNAVHSKEQWSVSAETYAKGAKNVRISTSVEMLFKQMDVALPFGEAEAVLDVGSGPGVTLARLIEEFGGVIPGGARLIASDFSAGMVEQVLKVQAEKKDEHPIWSRVQAKFLDAQVLEGVEDASISHITGTMVYNLVADGRRALEAAHRVLQPGGVIGMTLGAGADWMDMMALAARKIRGPTAPVFNFPKGYSTLEGIQAEFSTVGFSTEFIEMSEFFIDVAEPKVFIDGFIRSKNPGAMFFVGEYSEAELEEYVVELTRLVVEKYPEAPRKLKGSLIVVVGKKLL